jgi:protein-S-isoprenylcysteine O-methyltransferase Ste14
MTWPEGVWGRALAAVYLVAFVAMVVGLVQVLGSQLTGHDLLTWLGVVLFVAGQLAITGLARLLSNAVPASSTGQRRDPRGVAWNRLTLGRELAGAWRVVRG